MDVTSSKSSKGRLMWTSSASLAGFFSNRLVRTLLVPVLAGGTALTVAIIGAFIAGEASGTSGVNGFVESLSGSSSSGLGDLGLGLLAPLGFAFAAGMVAAVNPCGFAMLPAYLGLYLGSDEQGQGQGQALPVKHSARAVLVGGVVTVGLLIVGLVIGDWVLLVVEIASLVIWGGATLVVGIVYVRRWGIAALARRARAQMLVLARAVKVGSAVTGGFILLFGIAGLVIGGGASLVVDALPYIGLTIGIILTIAGGWMLGGGKLYSGFASQAASRIGNPNQVNIRGYFLFGVSYGVASLSCTLPIFLTVIGTSLVISDVPSTLGQLILYGLGMGLVITSLTVGMALFRGAMVGGLRKALPYVQPVSSIFMLVAGAYIVFYWLTIGGLG